MATASSGHRLPWQLGGLLVALVLVALAFLQSGLSDFGVADLLHLLQGDDTALASIDRLVVTELRLPRLLAALLVGAALGCAGCLLQRLTGNPLASPGLLGLNQGAALGMVFLLVSSWSFTPLNSLVAALVGAAVAMVLVFGVVRLATGGLAAESLLLFGALLSTLFGALTTIGLILDQHALDAIRFWLAGSLSLVEPAQLAPLATLVLTGLALAGLLCRPLQLLETGSDTARGLGANPRLILLAVSVVVLLLTAVSVAVSGPILFVGLVVPHLARLWIGERLHRQLAGSALLGALMLAVADLAVYQIDNDDRLPPGVALALIGVPWFIWLIRRRYLAQ
ncbi:MAG: iron ABC transporter permease [Alteromonadaceae bacterium]|nr:iron ABC transporter permease [Alteromonadaceae bacterium]